MASFFSSVRQGFNRQTNRSPNPQQQAERGTVQPLSPAPYNTTTSPAPPSPSLSPSMLSASDQSATGSNRKPPFFFREEYSGLIVKGNFMTLATKPKYVELGEWLAHQIVEQYRLLDSMLQIIKTADDRTQRAICNPNTCPTMSASGHTYTWLDRERRPIKIPATQYINLVQQWIMGKVSDPTLFPTDTSTIATSNPGFVHEGMATPTGNAPIPAGPTSLDSSLSALSGRDWLGKSSGFPESFETDLRSIYRQMMRCYAHLYHGHWLSPFWDVNAYRELNTCFIHFINVGQTYRLITEKEMEPMQPLIDLWIAKGLLPSATTEATNATTSSSTTTSTPQAQQAQQAQTQSSQTAMST